MIKIIVKHARQIKGAPKPEGLNIINSACSSQDRY